MPKLFKFFLLLIAFSLPLFWLWHTWGQNAYSSFLTKYFTFPLALKLGELPVLFSPQQQWNLFWNVRLQYIQSHYMNLIPFIALMLAVPALGWKKRLYGLGIGLALLVGWHIFFTLVLNHFQISYGTDRPFYRLYIPAISINSAVPVIIWAAVASKGVRELLGEIFVRPPSAEAGRRHPV